MIESFNPFSLKDKRVLITGASSGIGRQCAIDCSRMGAKVAIIGRNTERLNDTLALLLGQGHSMVSVDITDYESTRNCIVRLIEDIGPFDGFVNSAGVEKTLPLRSLNPQDYLKVFEANFVGGVNILKLLTKKGNYREGFKTVFISSITALIARKGTLAYTASKGAILSATRELAIELSTKGANVNCISPGTVLTPMMQKVLTDMPDEDRKKRLEGFPLGVGRPEDVSNACIFLLSDAARWITGQNIVVDGGFTAK